MIPVSYEIFILQLIIKKNATFSILIILYFNFLKDPKSNKIRISDVYELIYIFVSFIIYHARDMIVLKLMNWYIRNIWFYLKTCKIDRQINHA